jgi:ElaB/YqjD/DUF883 family membrane-anchored ribosome-binding protein
MSEPHVMELLNELHAKLQDVKSISENDRQLLTELSADIESLLARSGGLAAEHHRSVIERLQESITRFEVTHPDLTNVMAQVSKVLADRGI